LNPFCFLCVCVCVCPFALCFFVCLPPPHILPCVSACPTLHALFIVFGVHRFPFSTKKTHFFLLFWLSMAFWFLVDLFRLFSPSFFQPS
jgi:hypothetical protein